MYSTGEVASMLGVTPKALRHWDSIGLLVPGRRGSYRYYSDADLERGAAIVLYQSTGMALRQIASLLGPSLPETGPTNVVRDALLRHRKVLARRARELKSQLNAVDLLIKEMNMDNLSRYLGENMPKYQKEAEQRWDETPEWAQSQKHLRSLEKDDFELLKAQQEALAADLVAARDKAVQPGSDQAAELVERHKESISHFYEVSTQRQLILARMYVADERFHDAYRGAQDYLLELVTRQAAMEGIDVSNPTWN